MKPKNLAILAVVGVAVALAVVAKKRGAVCPPSAGLPETSTEAANSPIPAPTGLPRLVDLGAGKCVPCRMMAPILEDLKKTYAGRLEVYFIDVWENREAGAPYGIRVIPTQIFFDPSGKELWRHEGFLSKEDLLGQWKKLGFNFDAGVSPRK